MAGIEPETDAQAGASVISISIPGDVHAKLETANSSLLAHDLIILPPHDRSGASFYGPDDVYAVRLARGVGIDAAYLDEARNRDYLHEYSAGWAVEFAIAFSANVASADFVGITNYVMARAHQAVRKGLHIGPAEKVPVRITVASYHREPTGEVNLKGLKIEGSAAATAEALRILVDPQVGNSGQPGAPAIEAPAYLPGEISRERTKDPDQQ